MTPTNSEHGSAGSSPTNPSATDSSTQFALTCDQLSCRWTKGIGDASWTMSIIPATRRLPENNLPAERLFQDSAHHRDATTGAPVLPLIELPGSYFDTQQAPMIWQDLHQQSMTDRQQQDQKVVMGMGHSNQHLSSCCVRLVCCDTQQTISAANASDDAGRSNSSPSTIAPRMGLEFDFAWRLGQAVEHVAIGFRLPPALKWVTVNTTPQPANNPNTDTDNQPDRSLAPATFAEQWTLKDTESWTGWCFWIGSACDQTTQQCGEPIEFRLLPEDTLSSPELASPELASAVSATKQVFSAAHLIILASVPPAIKFPQTVRWQLHIAPLAIP